MQGLLSLASLFSIEAKDYEHFRFTESAAKTTVTVVFGFCIGIILASLLVCYQRNLPGAFVRALLRQGALSKESAKSAEELGFLKSVLIKAELRFGSMLKKVVVIVHADGSSVLDSEPSEPADKNGGEHRDKAADKREEDEQTLPSIPMQKMTAAEYTACRFYIPEALKYRAEVRYEREGNGPLQVVITSVLAIALGVLILRLLPFFLSVIDGLL
ncbi:MAG: hypothetical protein E7663_07330 [Ruminococcaceae bacterium]|nr:hypothetical protein [Oscillospiraceae bacterium]